MTDMTKPYGDHQCQCTFSLLTVIIRFVMDVMETWSNSVWDDVGILYTHNLGMMINS